MNKSGPPWASSRMEGCTWGARDSCIMHAGGRAQQAGAPPVPPLRAARLQLRFDTLLLAPEHCRLALQARKQATLPPRWAPTCSWPYAVEPVRWTACRRSTTCPASKAEAPGRQDGAGGSRAGTRRRRAAGGGHVCEDHIGRNSSSWKPDSRWRGGEWAAAACKGRSIPRRLAPRLASLPCSPSCKASTQLIPTPTPNRLPQLGPRVAPLAADVLSTAQSSIGVVSGTAVASAAASAAATLGITKKAEKEQQVGRARNRARRSGLAGGAAGRRRRRRRRAALPRTPTPARPLLPQARQRSRLEKLKAEVLKLQDLQQQELQLLQAQMNVKAQVRRRRGWTALGQCCPPCSLLPALSAPASPRSLLLVLAFSDLSPLPFLHVFLLSLFLPPPKSRSSSRPGATCRTTCRRRARSGRGCSSSSTSRRAWWADAPRLPRLPRGTESLPFCSSATAACTLLQLIPPSPLLTSLPLLRPKTCSRWRAARARSAAGWRSSTAGWRSRWVLGASFFFSGCVWVSGSRKACCLLWLRACAGGVPAA